MDHVTARHPTELPGARNDDAQRPPDTAPRRAGRSVRLECLLLASITAVAAAARLYRLGEWSPYIDELYTLRDTLTGGCRELQPFWVMTRAALDTLGISLFSLRILPCVFGILSIPILYLPFRHICGRPIALLAVALMAISPWHIYLSQLARWYSLLFLITSGSLMSLYLFVERRSPRLLILTVLLFAASFLLHLSAGFVIMIAVAYLTALLAASGLRPPGFDARRALLLLSGVVGAILLFIPRFLEFVEQWRAVKERLGWWGSTPQYFTLKVSYHVTPTIVLLALAGIVLLLMRRERRGLFLAVYTLVPFAALAVAGGLGANVSTKYLFFALPAALLAAAELVVHLVAAQRRHRVLLGVALGMAIALPALQTDALYFTSGSGHRDRFDEALGFVLGRRAPGDRLLLVNDFEAEEARFYVRSTAELIGQPLREEQIITPGVPDEIDLHEGVWVLTIGRSMPADAEGLDRWVAEHTRLLAEFPAHRGPEDNTVRVYRHAADVQIDRRMLGE